MILETAQLLCTAHWVLDGSNSPLQSILYKKTHVNHPSTLWVMKSSANYLWALKLLKELHKEWQYRFNHTHNHKTVEKLLNGTVNLNTLPLNIPIKKRSPFAIVMPDEYKISTNAVQSYQTYYRKGKADLLKYTKRSLPSFLN